jgi:hypothetical protein
VISLFTRENTGKLLFSALDWESFAEKHTIFHELKCQSPGNLNREYFTPSREVIFYNRELDFHNRGAQSVWQIWQYSLLFELSVTQFKAVNWPENTSQYWT